jgi:hypothetical protein
MHRIFAFVALASAAFGVWVLVGAPLEPDGMGRGTGAGWLGSYSGWSAGLLMGLVLAWFATIDWKSFPERLSAWLRLQRRRLALLLFGGACASVLLLF